LNEYCMRILECRCCGVSRGAAACSDENGPHMKFNPTVAQLCTIAELLHAKAPVEAIAKAVKLSPRAFRAWQVRLKTAAAVEAAKPAPVAQEEAPKPELSRASRRAAVFD
jgi:hypothetical protein